MNWLYSRLISWRESAPFDSWLGKRFILWWKINLIENWLFFYLSCCTCHIFPFWINYLSLYCILWWVATPLGNRLCFNMRIWRGCIQEITLIFWLIFRWVSTPLISCKLCIERLCEGVFFILEVIVWRLFGGVSSPFCHWLSFNRLLKSIADLIGSPLRSWIINIIISHRLLPNLCMLILIRMFLRHYYSNVSFRRRNRISSRLRLSFLCLLHVSLVFFNILVRCTLVSWVGLCANWMIRDFEWVIDTMMVLRSMLRVHWMTVLTWRCMMVMWCWML